MLLAILIRITFAGVILDHGALETSDCGTTVNAMEAAETFDIVAGSFKKAQSPGDCSSPREMAFVFKTGGGWTKYFDSAPSTTAAPYWKNVKGVSWKRRQRAYDSNGNYPDASELYVFLESADVSIKVHYLIRVETSTGDVIESFPVEYETSDYGRNYMSF